MFLGHLGGVLLHRHLGHLFPPLLTWVLWRQHMGFNPRTVACKGTRGLYVAGSALSGGRSQRSHFIRVMWGSLWGTPALLSCCSRVNLVCGGRLARRCRLALTRQSHSLLLRALHLSSAPSFRGVSCCPSLNVWLNTKSLTNINTSQRRYCRELYSAVEYYYVKKTYIIL